MDWFLLWIVAAIPILIYINKLQTDEKNETMKRIDTLEKQVKQLKKGR